MKKDDQVVSRQIAEEGAWEEDNVVLVLKAMSFYQDAVFIGEEVKYSVVIFQSYN